MADHKSSGTDTVVKVVLVFFISLLSFSIGTFVGKKFSDKQHRMASMEPSKPTKDGMNEDEGENTQASHAPSNEETITKNTDEHDSSMSEDEASTMSEEMENTDEANNTSPNKENGKTVADKSKLTKVLAREIASQGTAKYTIQVASYPTQEEAEKRVNELKSQKLESFSTETSIKGHQWYRVNVGVYSTIKEAQTKKTQLADQSKITTAIIQKLKK